MFTKFPILSCDRYNLSENKYYNTEHYLPYLIDNRTSRILMNNKEPAVLIYPKEICVQNNFSNQNPEEGFIIFTEERGFEKVPKRTYRLCILVQREDLRNRSLFVLLWISGCERTMVFVFNISILTFILSMRHYILCVTWLSLLIYVSIEVIKLLNPIG